VNDLPHSISDQSSVAMFADDTKCYRSVKEISNCDDLQNDLDSVARWRNDWKMDLNQTKSGVITVTRSRQPITAEYQLLDGPLKTIDCQKDLGIIVTNDLKCNKQVEEGISKANSILGFIRQTASNTPNVHVRKILYLSLVSKQVRVCQSSVGIPKGK
jgi:hypothetical protein